MGKYIQDFNKVDPGSKKACHPLLFLTKRRSIESPAGQRKRGPFGSPFLGRRMGAATVVSVQVLCTNMYIRNNTARK